MTHAEAVKAIDAGKRVTHPGFNTGWRVQLIDKRLRATHDAFRTPQPYAFDAKDKAATDWELVT